MTGFTQVCACAIMLKMLAGAGSRPSISRTSGLASARSG
jgi:hypothetical protein